LIILFFHKKIFKEEHELTGEAAASGSSLPHDDTNISAGGEQNVLNNNGSQISFEDTKRNPAQGTAGTEEAKDR